MSAAVDVVDAETGEVLHRTLETGEPIVEPKALAVIPRERPGIALRTPAEIETMAKHFAGAMLVPTQFRDKPADVFFALNYGLELGLSPAASLRAIHVIEGKPSLAADAMVAVVHSSGACRYFSCIESSAKIATYETWRIGEPAPRSKSFSIQQAAQATLLGKDNWKKYPQQMLEARAKAMLARDVFPDVLHGIYTPEELTAISDSEPPQQDAETKQAIKEILATKTVEQLEALAMSLATLGTNAKQAARRIYGQHLSILRGATS